jgi:hypothetical protein
LSTNTVSVYVGPSTVSTTSGIELAKGEEVFIAVDDPAKVHAVAPSVLNQKQTVTVTSAPGDTWTLTFDGDTTAPIAHEAIAAAVEGALEALASIGAGNVAVVGNGPYVVEFKGDLAGQACPLMTGRGGTNEVQSVAIDNTTTGGTFTLTDGTTTATIAFNAVAAAVETALEAVYGAGNVSVTGGAGPVNPWLVEFIGDLALTNVALMVGDATGLTGGAHTAIGVVETTAHAVGANEVQSVAIDGGHNAGTFTLTLAGHDTTVDIPFDANATVVESALETVLGAGNVSVAGGPGPGNPWLVEFTGTFAETEVAEMTGDGTLLAGGANTDVTISETVAHAVGANEVQTVTLNGTPGSGTFTLTLGVDTTAGIAFDATAADVAAALNAVLGAGSVSVTGGPGPAVPWLVEFTGTYAQAEVVEMTADATLLVGTVGVTDTPLTLVTFAITETQNPSEASRVAWIAQ